MATIAATVGVVGASIGWNLIYSITVLGGIPHNVAFLLFLTMIGIVYICGFIVPIYLIRISCIIAAVGMAWKVGHLHYGILAIGIAIALVLMPRMHRHRDDWCECER